ncbi:MAG: HAD-IC family P-type ATPase, partial [Phycisphaerales bacterium]|nr:HAD-IC family P-type ATPase [Phycisphaerales bacterium]
MTIEEEANAFARAFLTRAIEAYHNDLKAATGDDATVPHTLIVQAGNKLVAGQMEDGFVEPMTTRNGVELARRTAGKVGWAIVFFEAWFAPSDSEITGPVADRPDRASVGVIARIIQYNELILALLGGVLLVAGWVTYLNDGPHAWRVALLALSAIVTSTRTFPEAIESLGTLRLNVDVLMFVAAGGAASLGHFEEGAFLLFLFGLGSAGEHLAVGRARRAIEALSSLAPDTANVIDDSGEIIARDVETIDVGTLILMRPFDRIALDGVIIDGQSAIDESMLTGESVPVDKTVGDDVFAGTMNSAGTIRVRVTKASSESTLARIMTLVQEAQEGRSATQRFTDRVESWYVPLVFVMTILLLVIPPMLFEQSWSMWFIRSMAFMTAASPCALAIGTPAAILCGIARSAQLGVLVKGGEYLETLGRIDAIAFDKTGTLT